MSCFVMEEEGIAALAEFTADLLNYGFNHYGFVAPDELAKALPDCRDPYCFFDPQKIYGRLYALNVAAYIGRYGRDSNGKGQKLDGEQAPQIKTGDYCIQDTSGGHKLAPWHFRIAKLLHCYNYQVAEDATIKHPLAVALNKLERNLNSFIVTKSPQYDEAPGWGRFNYSYEEIQRKKESAPEKNMEEAKEMEETEEMEI